MRATAKDCLSDLNRRLKEASEDEREATLKLMAEFIRVAGSTVRSWLGGKSFPRGEVMFKLFAVLEACGYQVDEIESASESARKVAWMIAFEILYQPGQNWVSPRLVIDGDLSALYALGVRKEEVRENTRHRIEHVWKENLGVLERRRERLQKNMRFDAAA